MKRLLPFFLSLIPWLGFAQPYIPMLGTENQWRVVSCLNGCITNTYYTDGDTLVDGNVYRILDGYHYIQRNFLIRENVQEQKVYMKVLASHTLLPEFLLYDFSLMIGDTVNVYNPISQLPENGGQFVLDSIVQRPLETETHRFFYLHAVDAVLSSSQNTVWVEGIGALSLINSPGAAPTASDHLVCAFKDQVLRYTQLDSVYSCGPLSMQHSIPEQIGLFPNPATTTVRIQLPQGTQRPTQTNVYDMTGRLVHQQPFTTDIDVSTLSRGTYAIVVYTEEGNYRGMIQKL